MKPPLTVLAMLLLLGAAVFSAQRWGREAGRAACAAQLVDMQGELRRQKQALAVMREEGARRTARVLQAQATAQAAQVEAQTAATRVLALRPEGDACRAAEALIASEMP